MVFILAASLTFSQNKISIDSLFNYENEWWLPILEKHSKEILAFNNFEYIFEMGEENSIDNGVCTLKNAYLIINNMPP